VLVDGGEPRRRPAELTDGFTPPVVESQIHGHDPIDARVADDAQVRLAVPARLSVPLRADLAPGLHRIRVLSNGTGRVLLRASVRDEAPPPTELTSAAQPLRVPMDAPAETER
jgi:hypothetical protein